MLTISWIKTSNDFDMQQTKLVGIKISFPVLKYFHSDLKYFHSELKLFQSELKLFQLELNFVNLNKIILIDSKIFSFGIKIVKA